MSHLASAYVLQEAEQSDEDGVDVSEDENEDEDEQAVADDFINDDDEEDVVRKKRKKRAADLEDEELSADDEDLLRETLGPAGLSQIRTKKRLKKTGDLSDEEDDDDFLQPSAPPPSKPRREPRERPESPENRLQGAAADSGSAGRRPITDDDLGRSMSESEGEGEGEYAEAGGLGLTGGFDDDMFGELDLPEMEQNLRSAETVEGDEMDAEDGEAAFAAGREPDYEQMYEPAELEKFFKTQRDRDIRERDQPERTQLVHGMRQPLSAEEIEEEARWINDNVLAKHFITTWTDPVLKSTFLDEESSFLSSQFRKVPREAALSAIAEAVRLLSYEDIESASAELRASSGPREVPFIATFRKDIVQYPEVLNQHSLWMVSEADIRYSAFARRRRRLKAILPQLQQRLEKLKRQVSDPESDREAALIYHRASLYTNEDQYRADQIIDEHALSDIWDFVNFFFEDVLRDIKDGRETVPERAASPLVHKPSQQPQQSTDTMVFSQREAGELDDDDMEDGELGDDDELPQQGELSATQVVGPEESKQSTHASSSQSDEVIASLSARFKHLMARRLQKKKRDLYALSAKHGILSMLHFFGRTASDMAEAIYVRNSAMGEFKPCSRHPEEVAADFCDGPFDTANKVLKAARFCLAKELSMKPAFRAELRDRVRKDFLITVRPTRKGFDEIDPWHIYARYRFVTDKPISSLKDDEFLWLLKGQQDKFLKLNIHVGKDGLESLEKSFFDLLFDPGLGDPVAEAWNEQRREVLHMAVVDMALPALTREIRTTLRQEAEIYVREQCANYLRSIMGRQPFRPDRPVVENDEEEQDAGTRVISIGLGSMGTPSYVVALNGAGEVVEHVALSWLLVRQRSQNQADQRRKGQDLTVLKDIIARHRPDVIALAADSMDCRSFQYELARVQEDLSMGDLGIPRCPVELVDTDLARVFASSSLSSQEFPEFVPALKATIACGRRLQNPELEVAALFTREDDILCLDMHPLQQMLRKDELLRSLSNEVSSIVCRRGVDLHLAVNHEHASLVLPFVAGLGPRKAEAVLADLRKPRFHFNNRKQLKNLNAMGPVTACNAAGFLIITEMESEDVPDTEEELFEPHLLDITRIHPDHYSFAGKIAADALDLGLSGDDNDTAYQEGVETALQAILRQGKNIDQLRMMDIDAYSAELTSKGKSRMDKLLNDIREELINPFRDDRPEYARLSKRRLFTCFTGLTCESIDTGTAPLTIPAVSSHGFGGASSDKAEIFFHEPKQHEASLVNYMLIEGTVRDIKVLDGDPGRAPMSMDRQRGFVEVNCINDVRGSIRFDEVSDDPAFNVPEEIKISQPITCRLMGIDFDRFKLRLASKSSILRADQPDELMRTWHYDQYFDLEAAQAFEAKIRPQKKQEGKYLKRLIDHPSFSNITLQQAIQKLEGMAPGSSVFRPSSKGANHLTLSWKPMQGVVAHVDIIEHDKPNDQSLGSRLQIGKDEFSDLDEIIARYVDPKSDFVRLLQQHDHFRNEPKDTITELLRNDKAKNPRRIPYFIFPMEKAAGRFVIGYLPHKSPRFLSVDITPDGYCLVEKTLRSPTQLVSYFKGHYKELEARRARARIDTGAAAPATAPPLHPHHPHARPPPSAMPPQAYPPHRGAAPPRYSWERPAEGQPGAVPGRAGPPPEASRPGRAGPPPSSYRQSWDARERPAGGRGSYAQRPY